MPQRYGNWRQLSTFTDVALNERVCHKQVAGQDREWPPCTHASTELWRSWICVFEKKGASG